MSRDGAKPTANSSRRDFLKGSAAVAAGAAVVSNALHSKAFAAGDDVLKVGLIGCGGRGTGAAQQALLADKNVKLVALGDAFADRLESSLKHLQAIDKIKDKITVDDAHKFTGFDAYKKVIECCDVVLLTSPPHFRPLHMRAAVEAGKHIFAEKPVAVDGPGVRSILESAEIAKKKNLSVVSGLCWRYHDGMRETFKQIHDGAIGEIRSMQCSYNTGGLWNHPRKPEWSDMEFQVRNWLYFTWLSGDFNTEQHVHSLDKMAWAMKDEYPVKVTTLGGRQTRTGKEYGHIFDHMSSVYEYANGVKCFSQCRQQIGCDNDVSDWIYGSKGTCNVFGHQITDLSGKVIWKYKATSNMYQVEHDELFASIRAGKPINNSDYMAKSSLMGIMARMSAYTGKTVTWDQALNSKEDLTPPKYDWITLETPPVAIPGVTKIG